LRIQAFATDVHPFIGLLFGTVIRPYPVSTWQREVTFDPWVAVPRGGSKGPLDVRGGNELEAWIAFFPGDALIGFPPSTLVFAFEFFKNVFYR